MKKELDNVDACILLAERFIRRCKEVKTLKEGEEIWGGKCHAGMKRASLDLSRGLADLRIDGHVDGNTRYERKAARWL